MQTIKLFGPLASPYQLKLQALADYSSQGWERWPDQAPFLSAVLAFYRLGRGRRRGLIQRFPQMNRELDEYPAVPYYSLDGKQFFYDSSAMARHLDELGLSNAPLVPGDDGLAFICHLIDEAFDEFGLYMVHHKRWVTSASTNRMGVNTARELRKLIPWQKRQARHLARRQSQRCPYLFSVSPPGFDAGVDSSITPPALPGFPPTHDLLNEAWRNYLGAMEQILGQQSYLLGERFTLADASAYGQLGMNLGDGRAEELMQEIAPRTHAWLLHIQAGEHRSSTGQLQLSEQLGPLLGCICDTFVPLMQQNERAYHRARGEGQSLFNEAAFDQGEALYDGELSGHPFRSVVKTFQVSVWRELCEHWQELGEAGTKLLAQYPMLEGSNFE